MLHLYEEEEKTEGVRRRMERQLEFNFRLSRMPGSGTNRETLLLLEGNLLGKIRKRCRHKYPNRLPDEQLRLGV